MSPDIDDNSPAAAAWLVAILAGLAVATVIVAAIWAIVVTR